MKLNFEFWIRVVDNFYLITYCFHFNWFPYFILNLKIFYKYIYVCSFILESSSSIIYIYIMGLVNKREGRRKRNKRRKLEIPRVEERKFRITSYGRLWRRGDARENPSIRNTLLVIPFQLSCECFSPLSRWFRCIHTYIYITNSVWFDLFGCSYILLLFDQFYVPLSLVRDSHLWLVGLNHIVFEILLTKFMCTSIICIWF